jgi:hypothetical protein
MYSYCTRSNSWHSVEDLLVPLPTPMLLSLVRARKLYISGIVNCVARMKLDGIE